MQRGRALPAARRRDRRLFLLPGRRVLAGGLQAYPANPQPAAERSFPTLDIPTLIISGEADPVTPPDNGAAAAKYLPNSRQIVLKGMGHGNLHVGCVPNLVRQLFENGIGRGRWTRSCIERTAPLPFFLSPIGPEP